MTGPETKVKAKVKRLLDSLGAYHFPVQSVGMGEAGHPDRVASIQGEFLGVECKATKARHPTALQAYNLSRITTSGGKAFVVDADNFDAFSVLLLALYAPDVSREQRQHLWAQRGNPDAPYWR